MQLTCGKDPELNKALNVHLEGWLDALGASHYWDALADRITEETPSVLLDMQKVEVLSSAGVGILIRTMTRAQQHGGSLALFGCTPRVLQVIQVVNLESVLNLYETVEEARERLRELGSG
jgi:anti-anti-sigma factor